jgi:hypothetical protein
VTVLLVVLDVKLEGVLIFSFVHCAVHATAKLIAALPKRTVEFRFLDGHLFLPPNARVDTGERL